MTKSGKAPALGEALLEAVAWKRGEVSLPVTECVPDDHRRVGRIERLREIRAILDADPLPPMTHEEIAAEIEAARAELRHAAGA